MLKALVPMPWLSTKFTVLYLMGEAELDGEVSGLLLGCEVVVFAIGFGVA